MFEIEIESKPKLRKKDYLSKHGEWEHPNLKLRLCNYYPAELFQGIIHYIWNFYYLLTLKLHRNWNLSSWKSWIFFILTNDDWFIMSSNIYMYHLHKYDNDIDVKYLVIKTVYAHECRKNNIDISSTYSSWFIFIVVEIETWGQHVIQTRSTPRTQTSAAPSLRSAKQSSQAWNSVSNHFSCPFTENFMNIHFSVFP